MKKLLLIALTLLLSFKADAASLSQALASKMDYLSARQGVISGNLANISTPGYIAKDIVYKPTNSQSIKMATTNNGHISFTGNKVSGYKEIEDKTFIRNDGNSVKADQQMLILSNIQQEHTMATRLFSKHLAMQKLVVQTN